MLVHAKSMIPQVKGTVIFEVGKFARKESRNGYNYIAYPKNGGGFKKEGVRGDDTYNLFGKILNLRETYGFDGIKFVNLQDEKTIPKTELLDEKEFGELEKLSQAPVMR